MSECEHRQDLRDGMWVCNGPQLEDALKENEKLRAAIKHAIAYDYCNECGKGCIIFYDEEPCHAYSKPCGEVSALLNLVWPGFLERECKEFGGNVDV